MAEVFGGNNVAKRPAYTAPAIPRRSDSRNQDSRSDSRSLSSQSRFICFACGVQGHRYFSCTTASDKDKTDIRASFRDILSEVKPTLTITPSRADVPLLSETATAPVRKTWKSWRQTPGHHDGAKRELGPSTAAVGIQQRLQSPN